MGPATAFENGHRSCGAGKFTQLPNDVYNILLPLLATAPVELPTAEGKRLAKPAVSEISVYFTLLRLTYGWKDRRESLKVEIPPAKAAAMLGIDERSVWDAYAWLEARGFIERPHRKGNRTVVGVIPIEQVVQNLKGIKQASYPSKPRGKTRKSKTSEAACTETSEVGFGGSPGASLLSERKGKEEPSSERNVKVSSSMQAADQTPARPLAQPQEANLPDTASVRGHLDPHQESHTAGAETTRSPRQTPDPLPAEVDAVRGALKEATGKDSTAGDTLPAELLQRARKHGANAAVLCRWIVELAETKARRGNPVASHGLFRRVLEEEVLGWMRRNARTVDILTPQTLGPDSVVVDSITAAEGACSSGPATASPSHCIPVSGGRPESAESWRPPKPPPPPKCPLCRDNGYVEQGGTLVRCSCPAGQTLDERVLELVNRYKGRQNDQPGERRSSGDGLQGTSSLGLRNTAAEDKGLAVADRQVKEAVAASAI